MAEYIDRELLLDYLQIVPIDLGYREIEDVERFVKELPAANVVERKTGTWCADYDGYSDGEPVYDMWWCSACGEYFDEWDDKPTWNYV